MRIFLRLAAATLLLFGHNVHALDRDPNLGEWPYLEAPPVEAPAPPPLPEAARTMIDTAIASGDRATVRAIIVTARSAFPDHVEEINLAWRVFQGEQRELAAAEAAAQERAIRQAGLFQRWSGQGQIGGFQATGNSDEIGITAALDLKREGIDWEHRLRGSIDYRRTNGVTSREKITALYEPRFQISSGLFAYGLAQYERDRRQGFAGRYSMSGGLGYKIVDSQSIEFSAKAGPAYRITEYRNGESSNRLAGLLGLDFDWRISDSLKLTQDANSTFETGSEALLIVDGSNTSLSAITGLEAKVSDRLTTRLSWTIEYDSNPPAGSVNTDTLSRFTLIYGF